MSDGWGFYRPEPRRPPPPGGRTAPATARRGSGGFASTWWGAAWVDALERRARLDPNRLPRGRTYARQGYVQSIEMEPGRISAAVAGSRPTPYIVAIRVRTFGDAEWEGVYDVIASRAAHAAALLDGDLEPGVVDDAREAGVELLPDVDDLHPACSCPDWADPCKHAAAVCYLVASELDEDPFRLFALRGRSREDVLAGVRDRRGGGTTDAGDGDDEESPSEPTGDHDRGVVARAAWQIAGASERSFPVLPAPATRPGSPAPWPMDPPPGAPFGAESLRALAADAASRAWQMVRGEGESALGLSAAEDLARRAASALGTDGWPSLLARSGQAAGELERVAVAWQHGREAGVAVAVEEPWTPDARLLVSAREALVAVGAPARSVRASRNRVTVASWRGQLRLARDGRWWGLTKEGNRWELATAGFDDVDDAAEALLMAVD